VIATYCTVVDDYVPSPQGDGIPLTNIRPGGVKDLRLGTDLFDLELLLAAPFAVSDYRFWCLGHSLLFWLRISHLDVRHDVQQRGGDSPLIERLLLCTMVLELSELRSEVKMNERR
jgi:hypothetical protein